MKVLVKDIVWDAEDEEDIFLLPKSLELEVDKKYFSSNEKLGKHIKEILACRYDWNAVYFVMNY